MRILKKLGMSLCIAAIGVMTFSLCVNAKSNDSGYFNDVRDSYTEPFYGFRSNYTDDQIIDLLDVCYVQEPQNYYMDSTIKKAAKKYLDKGSFYVGDLRYMTEFGLYVLNSDKNNNAFNYGIVVEDLDDMKHTLYICKCSPKDYKSFVELANDKNKIKSDCFIQSHNKNLDKLTYSYDSKNNVLTAKLYWNN